MKNRTKLILANVFALLAVVLILTGSNLLGIELKSASDSFLIKTLIIVIPQMGFIYLYWMLFKKETRSEIV